MLQKRKREHSPSLSRASLQKIIRAMQPCTTLADTNLIMKTIFDAPYNSYGKLINIFRY